MADLLPISATPQERALSEVTGNRIESIPVPIRDLWNPWKCPLELLPWLAWALSVDWWDDAWSEDVKRKVVAGSIAIHRHKGTVWAVKEYLKILGYRDAQIIEGVEPPRHDGTHKHNGLRQYVNPGHWALFRVVCDLGNDMGLDARTNERVVSAINAAKNLRSHLYAVGYKITLSDSNTSSRADSLLLRVGLHLESGRPAVRDGSICRSAAPWLHDGTIKHDGTHSRAGNLSGPVFGPARIQCPVKINLKIESKRAPRFPRDGSLKHDGRARNDGSAYDYVETTTAKRIFLRDGSQQRDGAVYGARVTEFPADSPYPVRDGRFRHDGTLKYAHTYTEAIKCS